MIISHVRLRTTRCFNNEGLSITQWLLGRTRGGFRFHSLSRCNRLITVFSLSLSHSLIPGPHRLRQGLSADVAARPSAHPLVPISINLTQNAITVQSAPVAASWCRAVCAVMSCRFLRPSLALFISLLSQINFSSFSVFLFPFASLYLNKVSTRLVQTVKVVNEPTENLTFTPTSHSYALERNNEREEGQRERKAAKSGETR